MCQLHCPQCLQQNYSHSDFRYYDISVILYVRMYIQQYHQPYNH